MNIVCKQNMGKFSHSIIQKSKFIENGDYFVLKYLMENASDHLILNIDNSQQAFK